MRGRLLVLVAAVAVASMAGAGWWAPDSVTSPLDNTAEPTPTDLAEQSRTRHLARRAVDLRRRGDPAAAARRVLRAYGLVPDRVELLRSTATDVFRVEAVGRRLSLRLYRAPVGNRDPLAGDAVLRTRRGLGEPAVLAAQFDWIDALSTAGVTVPAVVADRTGARVHRPPRRRAEAASRPIRHAVLLEWIDGTPADENVGPAEMTAVGAYIATAHALSVRRPAPRPDLLPRWDWGWVFGPGAPVWTVGPSRLDASQMKVVERVATAIDRSLTDLGSAPDTFGTIHRDLTLNNLILGEHGVGAIDFDHTGQGYYLHDLAVLRTSLMNRQRSRAGQLWRAMLSGYRSIRRLPAGHATHIQALRALHVSAGLNRSIEQSVLGPELAGPPARSADAAVRRLAAWLETVA